MIRANAFTDMALVGNLNFMNNKIDRIQEMHIKPKNRVRVLRFHGNHLLETPAPGAVEISGVENLLVLNNHFPCDCHVHTLLESPLANSTNGDFLAKNFCISPLEINGRPMSGLDLDAIGRCQEQVTQGNLEASHPPKSSSAIIRSVSKVVVIASAITLVASALVTR